MRVSNCDEIEVKARVCAYSTAAYDDEGRDEADRADERERVRALRVEEVVGIDAGDEVADADDADDDDREECDEGSDPANDHGMCPPPVLERPQLYGTLTARLRRAISSAFIPSGSMARATRAGGRLASSVR